MVVVMQLRFNWRQGPGLSCGTVEVADRIQRPISDSGEDIRLAETSCAGGLDCVFARSAQDCARRARRLTHERRVLAEHSAAADRITVGSLIVVKII